MVLDLFSATAASTRNVNMPVSVIINSWLKMGLEPACSALWMLNHNYIVMNQPLS